MEKIKSILRGTKTTTEVNAAARGVVREFWKRHPTIVEYAERVFDVATAEGIQYLRLLRAVERIAGVGV